MKIAKKLILPYFIFQLIYSIFFYFLYSKSTFTIDPLNPHWSLWFLISLFCWNLMLIGFAKLSAPTGLLIAFGLGLGVGYVDWISNYLSLSRTFVYFPLFLLGYHLTKDHIKTLTRPSFKIGALISFTVVFLGFYFNPDIDYKWLLGSKPYSMMEAASISSMFTRLSFYLLSLLMVFSFLTIVPKKQYFFTDLGKNTLYVYLLHGFFVRVFRESEVQDFFHSPERFILLAFIALVLTLLLSSKYAAAFAQPLIEFKTSRINRLKTRIGAIVRFYRRKMLSQ